MPATQYLNDYDHDQYKAELESKANGVNRAQVDLWYLHSLKKFSHLAEASFVNKQTSGVMPLTMRYYQPGNHKETTLFLLIKSDDTAITSTLYKYPVTAATTIDNVVDAEMTGYLDAGDFESIRKQCLSIMS